MQLVVRRVTKRETISMLLKSKKLLDPEAAESGQVWAHGKIPALGSPKSGGTKSGGLKSWGPKSGGSKSGGPKSESLNYNSIAMV